jgi:hypothetical protein
MRDPQRLRRRPLCDPDLGEACGFSLGVNASNIDVRRTIEPPPRLGPALASSTTEPHPASIIGKQAKTSPNCFIVCFIAVTVWLALEPSRKSRPVISKLPSSVNWRRRSFLSACSRTGSAAGSRLRRAAQGWDSPPTGVGTRAAAPPPRRGTRRSRRQTRRLAARHSIGRLRER